MLQAEAEHRRRIAEWQKRRACSQASGAFCGCFVLILVVGLDPLTLRFFLGVFLVGCKVYCIFHSMNVFDI